MLSSLRMWWYGEVTPLRAVIEVSSVLIVKTSGHGNWHELCHVDGDEVGHPEAADASLHRRG